MSRHVEFAMPNLGRNPERPYSELPGGYEFDAVGILCGGVQKGKSRYFPTYYSQSDGYGMLGGRQRLLAALGLYLEGRAKTFIFSGGRKQAVNASEIDLNVPSEAAVYKDSFLRYIDRIRENPSNSAIFENLEAPELFLDESASNTEENIKNIFAIMKQQGFGKLAIVTNMLHSHRVELMTEVTECLNEQKPPDVRYLFAEKEVGRAFKWRNLASFRRSHPQSAIRSRNERIGREGLLKGIYQSKS